MVRFDCIKDLHYSDLDYCDKYTTIYLTTFFEDVMSHYREIECLDDTSLTDEERQDIEGELNELEITLKVQIIDSGYTGFTFDW